MSQPSYASDRPTPSVPTDVAGEAGNMVDVQNATFNDRVSAAAGDLSGMTVPGPGHPAYGGNAGQGALGYQGFNDAELKQINND